MMSRFAAVGIAVAVLAAAGIYDAARASKLADLQSSGVIQAKLDAIPLAFGDWTGEVRPFDEKILKHANALAHRYIRFTRGGSKPAGVDILLLAGDPGEIGAHDPERCYGGTGYRASSVRTRKLIADEGNQHSLWAQRFEKETLPAGSLEVAWGWTADGHWNAAEDARYEYSSRTILYKIYATRSLAGGDDVNDATTDLLTALAPLVRTALAGVSP
jgi:hypothetical protein